MAYFTNACFKAMRKNLEEKCQLLRDVADRTIFLKKMDLI
jgi:hypothetical protein